MKRKHDWLRVHQHWCTGNNKHYWCRKCGTLRIIHIGEFNVTTMEEKPDRYYYRKPKNIVAPHSASPNPSSFQFSTLEEVFIELADKCEAPIATKHAKHVARIVYEFMGGNKKR